MALPSGTGPEPLRWARSGQELLPGILDLERLEVDLLRGHSSRDDL